MTEQELSQLGLLEEFSITELEQRLEFEAWCDSCTDDCPNTTCEHNGACPPLNNCGGGGGGGGCGDSGMDELCIIEPC